MKYFIQWTDIQKLIIEADDIFDARRKAEEYRCRRDRIFAEYMVKEYRDDLIREKVEQKGEYSEVSPQLQL